MAQIFLLSIFHRFADMILAKEKRWEFRENPEFGRAGERTLRVGDALFVVSVGGPSDGVRGLGVVEKILRGEEMEAYFQNVARGSSFAGEGPGADYFRREILGRYKTALKLDAAPLDEPIPLSAIRKRSTGRPWKGLGLTHVSQLHRHHIGQAPVEEVLSRLVRRSGVRLVDLEPADS